MSVSQVQKAIHSFKAGTAPGPSGLRAEHLKEAIGTIAAGSGSRAAAAVTALVNLLSAGKVPPEVAVYLCGSRLYAAIKKDGGLRPVAVGNLSRRLTSKCLAFSVSPRAALYLRPLQFGVGVKGGTEGIVHSIRSITEDENIHHEDKWVLQVDLENAHNLVDREAAFSEIRTHFPEISRWFETCYSVQAELLWGQSVILSCTGFHQGCPLAGIGCALVIQPVALRIQQEVPRLKAHAWFQDDVNLVGKKTDLAKALSIIKDDGPPRGLHLKPKKSKVWCPEHPLEDKFPLGPEIQRVLGHGIQVLGSPVGHVGFSQGFVEAKVADLEELLGNLHFLKDPHSEFALLGNCFSLP